jgi:hypothetical protein
VREERREDSDRERLPREMKVRCARCDKARLLGVVQPGLVGFPPGRAPEVVNIVFRAVPGRLEILRRKAEQEPGTYATGRPAPASLDFQLFPPVPEVWDRYGVWASCRRHCAVMLSPRHLLYEYASGTRTLKVSGYEMSDQHLVAKLNWNQEDVDQTLELVRFARERLGLFPDSFVEDIAEIHERFSRTDGGSTII